MLAILLLAASGVDAQKPRKGFVLNLGAGPAFINIKAAGNGVEGTGESKIAVGTDFKIGYAPSDQLLIYYSNDAAFFNYDYSVPGFEYDVLVISGLSGIGATWFLKPRAPSAYVDATIGIAAWNEIDTDDGAVESMTGLGLSVGGGFEFARHWLVDADLIVGRPRDDEGYGLNTMTLRVGLIWLLY
jgi:hypothetical protein